MSTGAVPVLDLSSSASEHLDVSSAIKSLGFLALQSPAQPTSAQVDELFAIAKEFFENESIEEKKRCGITVENKGWVDKRQESLDPTRNPNGDNKEVFNIASYAASGNPSQPMPSRLAPHTAFIAEFIKSCHALGMTLLEAFALDMDLPKDYFTSKHSFGEKDSSILRLLYYPPTEPQSDATSPPLAPTKDIRAGAHSDYGTLTLLFQKDVGGLQILSPNSSSARSENKSGDLDTQWLDAPVIPDSVLVNIGDAFDFWSGGRFPSTQHRVVAPRNVDESVARFSIAYFLHPADDELLERISQSTESSKEDERSVIHRFGIDPSTKLTAKEWLLQRLYPTYTGRKEVAS